MGLFIGLFIESNVIKYSAVKVKEMLKREVKSSLESI